CPVGTEAYKYVMALANRDVDSAYAIARQPNPFPYVCGRVCAHPCEEACRRGVVDSPVSIRALKRTATELHDLSRRRAVAGPSMEKRDERIAVIGAGPAGLSCAHDLASLGYGVTVFEASSRAGGMLALGIPEYRLPREILDREINAILDLGVELICRQRLGTDFTLADLKQQGFHAVFVGIGAHRGKDLRMEGLETDGVVQGVEFLLNVNLGYRTWLGHQVAVIGGGDVAMDSARTALRVESGHRPPGVPDGDAEEYLALDAAGAAARLGSREVHVIYRRSRAEMPAHMAEVYEAEKEGIQFHLLTNPVRVEPDVHGRLHGLWCLKMELGEPDESGRRRPIPIEGSEFFLKCDSVLLAVGQSSDLSFIQESDGIETTSWGTIKADPTTLATTAPGIYAGGDCVFGPRLLIDAEGDGRRAARSIHRFLRGGAEWRESYKFPPVEIRDFQDLYDAARREPCPVLSLDRRTGFTEVELPLSLEAAAREGNRCLHCHQNIILDGERCILCGGCVDVCPYQCISMVSAGEVDWTAAGEDVSEEAREGQGYAMILDEATCIRCGLCIYRCPTDAITMHQFETQGEWRYV
ncbi:MAG: FAD-dependent oxidoreductase, partial [Pirellulaceae bacterium]